MTFELHHRIKNNLQIISSLIGIQMHGIGMDGEAVSCKRCLDPIQKRIHAIGLVHELSYQNSELSRIPVNEYLNRLLAFRKAVTPSGKVLSVDIDGTDETIPVEQSVPVGLIVDIVLDTVCDASQQPDVFNLSFKKTEAADAYRFDIAPVKLDENGQERVLVEILVKQLKGTICFSEMECGCSSLEISIPNGIS